MRFYNTSVLNVKMNYLEKQSSYAYQKATFLISDVGFFFFIPIVLILIHVHGTWMACGWHVEKVYTEAQNGLSIHGG